MAIVTAALLSQRATLHAAVPRTIGPLYRLSCGELRGPRLCGKDAKRIGAPTGCLRKRQQPKSREKYSRERRCCPVKPRYITITVRYDRKPRCGRSLGWIAPELKDSALTMTEDRLDDPTPSRTWAGLVDGPTYERFAEAWRLPKDTELATIRQSCPACRGAGAWSDCGPLGGRRRYSEEVGSTAIASIETRRPRGSRTCAGADRAGGGSGMWRAYTSLRRRKSSTSA